MSILSLGGGVQSTTLALLAARHQVGPMPACAIFADTGAEPRRVYRHIDWLESQIPFPVYRVSAGDLRSEILGAMRGLNRMDGRPPFFIAKGGMLRRQCTHDYKILPITRKIRALLGLKKGARAPREVAVDQWLGISTDEAARMKPSRFDYIRHRWPLIELGMSRGDCLRWCESNGFPTPPKSACTFCPLHNDAQWAEMKTNAPADFQDAVAVDKAIRPGMPGPKRPGEDRWYVHRKREPLEYAVAGSGRSDNQFMNECDGMCGV
jgi:hypothetical protein